MGTRKKKKTINNGYSFLTQACLNSLPRGLVKPRTYRPFRNWQTLGHATIQARCGMQLASLTSMLWTYNFFVSLFQCVRNKSKVIHGHRFFFSLPHNFMKVSLSPQSSCDTHGGSWYDARTIERVKI